MSDIRATARHTAIDMTMSYSISAVSSLSLKWELWRDTLQQTPSRPGPRIFLSWREARKPLRWWIHGLRMDWRVWMNSVLCLASSRQPFVLSHLPASQHRNLRNPLRFIMCDVVTHRERNFQPTIATVHFRGANMICSPWESRIRQHPDVPLQWVGVYSTSTQWRSKTLRALKMNTLVRTRPEGVHQTDHLTETWQARWKWQITFTLSQSSVSTV